MIIFLVLTNKKNTEFNIGSYSNLYVLIVLYRVIEALHPSLSFKYVYDEAMLPDEK
jgi:hypothetical protein